MSGRGAKPATRSTRRIAVVTGTRAEYGLFRSTMTALGSYPQVRLQVVVTGLHLLRKFGHTVDEIAADGWKVDVRVPMQHGDDRPTDQAEGLARGVAGMGAFFHRERTHMVVVLGDRIEAMAGALAAATTGTVLAHMHGGDLAAGDLDDRLRHAISKLADIHFPATTQAGRRLMRMGEPAERVHVVGAPGLDRLREFMESRPGRGAAMTWDGIDAKRALIIQHPCGRDRKKERQVMGMLLRAVETEGLQALCLYPNTDRGHQGIVEAIESHAAKIRNGGFQVRRSIPRDEFLEVLHQADVLVGNSSSGIIEAAYVGTPALNIGDRQRGRQTSGAGVVHSKETSAGIRQGLRRALQNGRVRQASSVYGDGRAGARIAEILATIDLEALKAPKLNTY